MAQHGRHRLIFPPHHWPRSQELNELWGHQIHSESTPAPTGCTTLSSCILTKWVPTRALKATVLEVAASSGPRIIPNQSLPGAENCRRWSQATARPGWVNPATTPQGSRPAGGSHFPQSSQETQSPPGLIHGDRALLYAPKTFPKETPPLFYLGNNILKNENILQEITFVHTHNSLKDKTIPLPTECF